MRERIIDGTLYRGEVVPGAWDCSLWEANGHREFSARPAIQWHEVGPARPPMDWEQWIASAESEEEQLERQKEYEAHKLAKREKNLERAAKRAQTMCRRFIKAAGFNELLTITYRDNQTDIELFKKHFAEWVRRMKRALGGRFAYCAGFEPQDRKAWHAHVACHKLPKHVQHRGVKIPSWRLGTEVWRSVVGPAADGNTNGLVFVGGKAGKGKTRGRTAYQSLAKLASYVSKYITKHYELCPDEANRYSHSQGLGKGERFTHTVTDVFRVWDMLDIAICVADEGNIISHVCEEDRGYWLVTEGPPSPPPAFH